MASALPLLLLVAAALSFAGFSWNILGRPAHLRCGEAVGSRCEPYEGRRRALTRFSPSPVLGWGGEKKGAQPHPRATDRRRKSPFLLVPFGLLGGASETGGGGSRNPPPSSSHSSFCRCRYFKASTWLGHMRACLPIHSYKRGLVFPFLPSFGLPFHHPQPSRSGT